MKEQQLCCGTTCNKKAVAEYISKLENERDGVLLQLNNIKRRADYECFDHERLKALLRAIDVAPLINIINEIKAKAIEDFSRSELSHHNAESFSMMTKAMHYAQNIRRGVNHEKVNKEHRN